MSSEELARELGIKESYLRSHWRSIVDSNSRIGITLVKLGRGAAANYGIKSYGDKEIRFTIKEYN